MTDTRIPWDDYFLNIAKAVALRADCTRRQASAVIVKGHRIVSTGYNGAPAGRAGCLSAGACPRGNLSPTELAHYASYDEGPGRCIAVHAEANALLYANRADVEGGTLYTWSSSPNHAPCVACWRLIGGSGVSRVVYFEQWEGSWWVKRCYADGTEITKQTPRYIPPTASIPGITVAEH